MVYRITKIFFILTALFALCARAAEDSNKAQYNRNLIIYYDAQTGNRHLLNAVKIQGFPILYRYKNFNAVTVRVPQKKNIEQAIQHFEKIKGVLQVSRDHIMAVH